MAKKHKKNGDITNLVLTAVALSMGIASLVLAITNKTQPSILMPLGLSSLALARLQK